MTVAATCINSETKPGTEDVILNACEATNMDMNHIDLVTLSVHETGIGEVKNCQDTFGLHRASKVSGIKAIQMRLWKVDDTTNQELMINV